jgi:hypothetical protein
MTFVINGPFNGNGFIFGNSSGDDIINAFANMNMVLSQGANDTINLLGNMDIVNLGDSDTINHSVSDTVNVYGGSNTITGDLDNSFISVNGGTGNNTVSLDNDGGTTNVSLAGFFNHITVNAGSTNSIVSGAGNATIAVGASPAADDDVGQGWSTSIILGGMSNTVTGDDQNTTINGGQGFDTIRLADGNNSITEAGVGNNITVGSGTNTIVAGSGSDTVTITQGDLGGDDVVAVPTDSVTIAGTSNQVTAGDENVNVFGGTGFATITMGNGNDNVMTSGSANHVTLGNGNDIVNIAASNTAGGNTVTLGNGNDTVNVDGANNHITVGNGADSITALGGGNVIHAGAGVGPAGPDNITVGDNSMVFGSGLKAGSVIDSIGSHNDVSLSSNSSGTIKDEPTGNSLFAEFNGNVGGTYTGKVTITGFGNDLATGRIDFDNVKGGVNGAFLTSAANVFANSTSDGMGGTLIKLAGGGSLDLANSTFNGSTFV